MPEYLVLVVSPLVAIVIAAFTLDIAQWIIRLWTWCYTVGLGTELRMRRRGEIASHVFDEITDGRDLHYHPSQIGVRLLAECVLGVPSDALWRIEHSMFGRSRYGELARLGLKTRWQLVVFLTPMWRVTEIQAMHADEVLEELRLHLRDIPPSALEPEGARRKEARLAVKRAERTARVAHSRAKLSRLFVVANQDLVRATAAFRQSETKGQRQIARLNRWSDKMSRAMSWKFLGLSPFWCCEYHMRRLPIGGSYNAVLHTLTTTVRFVRSHDAKVGRVPRRHLPPDA